MSDSPELVERKMNRPKRAHARTRVVASAGNTKVETAANDDDFGDNRNNIDQDDDDGVSAPTSETPTFIISSRSKSIIRSILSLFVMYDRISAQHKIDSADAIGHDIASSHIKLDFKLIKRPKHAHEIAIFERGTSSKGVTCTSLREFMENRTTAMSYQRVLRMAEMIYEQMTALEAQGLAPPYYSLDDILVINESFFCFINDAKLFQIETTGNRRVIHVTRAISRSGGAFFAPELIGEINALPYSADVRSSYYSYGLLVAHCATLNSNLITPHEKGKEDKGIKDEKDDDDDADDEGMEQQSGGKRQRKQQQQQQQQPHNRRPTLMRALEPLQYTKLYWLILRCCDPAVSRRTIVYL